MENKRISLEFDNLECNSKQFYGNDTQRILLDLCHIQYALHNNEFLTAQQRDLISRLKLGTQKKAIQLRIAKIASELDTFSGLRKESFYNAVSDVPSPDNLHSHTIRSLSEKDITSIFEDYYEIGNSHEGMNITSSSDYEDKTDDLRQGWGKILNDMYMEVYDIYNGIQGFIQGKPPGPAHELVFKIFSNPGKYEVPANEIEIRDQKELLALAKIIKMEKRGGIYKVNTFVKNTITGLIKGTPVLITPPEFNPLPYEAPSKMPPPSTEPSFEPLPKRDLPKEPKREEFTSKATMGLDLKTLETITGSSSKFQKSRIEKARREDINYEFLKKVKPNSQSVQKYRDGIENMLSGYNDLVDLTNNANDMVSRLMDILEVPEATQNKLTSIMNWRDAINETTSPLQWSKADAAFASEAAKSDKLMLKEIMPFMKEKFGENTISKFFADSGDIQFRYQIDALAEFTAEALVSVYIQLFHGDIEPLSKFMDEELIKEFISVGTDDEQTRREKKKSTPFEFVRRRRIDPSTLNPVLFQQTTPQQFDEAASMMINHYQNEAQEYETQGPDAQEKRENSKNFLTLVLEKIKKMNKRETIALMTMGMIFVVLIIFLGNAILPLFLVGKVAKDTKMGQLRFNDRIRTMRNTIIQPVEGEPLIQTPRDVIERKNNLEKKIARESERIERDIGSIGRTLSDIAKKEMDAIEKFPQIKEEIDTLMKKSDVLLREYDYNKSKLSKQTLSKLLTLIEWDSIQMVEGQAFNEGILNTMRYFEDNDNAKRIFQNTTVKLINEALAGKSGEEIESLIKPRSSWFSSSNESVMDSVIDTIIENDDDLNRIISTGKVPTEASMVSKVEYDIKASVKAYLKNVAIKAAQVKYIEKEFFDLKEDQRVAIERTRELARYQQQLDYKFSRYDSSLEEIKRQKELYGYERNRVIRDITELQKQEHFRTKIQAFIDISKRIGLSFESSKFIIGTTVTCLAKQDQALFEAYTLWRESSFDSLSGWGAAFKDIISYLPVGDSIRSAIFQVFGAPARIFDSFSNVLSAVYSQWSSLSNSSEISSYYEYFASTVWPLFSQDVSLFKWLHLLGLSCSMQFCLIIMVPTFASLKNLSMSAAVKFESWKRDMDELKRKSNSWYEGFMSKFYGTVSLGFGYASSAFKLAEVVSTFSSTATLGFQIASLVGVVFSLVGWIFPQGSSLSSLAFSTINWKLITSLTFATLLYFNVMLTITKQGNTVFTLLKMGMNVASKFVPSSKGNVGKTIAYLAVPFNQVTVRTKMLGLTAISWTLMGSELNREPNQEVLLEFNQYLDYIENRLSGSNENNNNNQQTADSNKQIVLRESKLSSWRKMDALTKYKYALALRKYNSLAQYYDDSLKRHKETVRIVIEMGTYMVVWSWSKYIMESIIDLHIQNYNIHPTPELELMYLEGTRNITTDSDISKQAAYYKRNEVASFMAVANSEFFHNLYENDQIREIVQNLPEEGELLPNLLQYLSQSSEPTEVRLLKEMEDRIANAGLIIDTSRKVVDVQKNLRAYADTLMY